MSKFYVMFQGKQLGDIEANNYEEALSRVEEVITIEELEESENPEIVEADYDDAEGWGNPQTFDVLSLPFSNPVLPEVKLKTEADLKQLAELFEKPIFRIENVQVYDPRYPNGEIPLTKKHSTLAMIHENILYKYIYNIDGGKADEKGKDK
jgi:hypothetical protein